VVPDAHRVVASWAVQPPGGGSLVGVTLFDPLAGKAVREWKWPGRAIDLLPSSRAFVALVVRDRFWAPAARLMAHWIAGVAPAWLRAFQRYEPVGPPGPPGWRWAWPGLKAFDEVREDLFSADIDTTPELPDRTSDLYLVQAGDGALAAQCTVGGMLERLVEPGAPPPDPSQAWLLRGHLSGSLLRVELAGSGLVLTDVGRATWQDRAALAVPSTEPADQGSLVLLGPDDDPRFHLIAVTANGISERWAADLVPLSRGLSEVRLAMPGILTIEDALDRTLVVNVQTGQPHEPAFFNGATVIGHVARQVWLSALEPRSVVLMRIDQRAPERRLRIDTLGSRQMLFDRSGHADLGLALIQSDAVFASEGVISVFRMDVLTSPLDSLLDDFLQAETRDHEAR
jgi:hypothetical protein